MQLELRLLPEHSQALQSVRDRTEIGHCLTGCLIGIHLSRFDVGEDGAFLAILLVHFAEIEVLL